MLKRRRVAAGLFEEVDSLVRSQLRSGLADSSRLSYTSGQDHWLRFCWIYSAPIFLSGGIDDEAKLMRFCSILSRSCSYKTIKSYLVSVRSLHVDHAKGDPLLGKITLERLLRGIRRQLGDNSVQKRALLASMLRAGREKLFHHSNPTDRATWAAVSLAWHGLLRCSEFVPLSTGKFDPEVQLCVRDVEFFPAFGAPTHAIVTVKASKADPFHHGQIVVVAATGTDLCAVQALRQMFLLSGKRRPDDALFVREDGRPLCRSHINRAVQGMAVLAGVPKSHYGTHSLRRGGATALFNAGFSRDFIQLMGRWKSDAFKLYISQPVAELLNVGKQMEQASEQRDVSELILTY